MRAVPDTSPRRKLLQQQKTNPAYVTGQRWDVLAWNSAACSIIADFEALSVEERNIVRLVFTNDELRRRLVDWEGIAQRMLAQFRASSGRYTDDAQFGSLIEELSRLSPEFARWWPLREVRGRQDGRKEFIHPQVEYLSFEYSTLQVNDSPDLRIAIYLPASEETARKLEQLEGAREPLKRPEPISPLQ